MQNIAENLISEDGIAVIRIVKDIFCEVVINAFGKPYLLHLSLILPERQVQHLATSK
jgi:hypothetical protein